MKKIRLATLTLALIGAHAINAMNRNAAAQTTITVEPTVFRQIDGIGELDRQTLFNLADGGQKFDQRVEPDIIRFLLDDLNVTFGRRLGPVMSYTYWGNHVTEDPDRPGFADLDALDAVMQPKAPGSLFNELANGRLDVAAHGAHNAFPIFMGKFQTDYLKQRNSKDWLPQNIEAAAELSAKVMADAYTDFDRPRFYEPVNEPHWNFVSDPHIADWHVRTKQAVQQSAPDVLVGGPCLSVAYFYKRNFQALNGFADFFKNTRGELDFYSFHVYDYMRWDGEKIHGRITTGMPLEGVIDLVQAHFVKEAGKEYDIVVSEHGGYFNHRPEHGPHPVEAISAEFFPDGSGFDYEMKQRSIAGHVLVSSAIANTLVFMDHPHVVKKAVPFILLHSMSWDPRYYAVSYVAHNFEDKSDWVESDNLHFFRFFRDLAGHRVTVTGTDPDVQVRAFVDGSVVRVVLNNLSREPEAIDLQLPPGAALKVRRYTRQSDFTPALTEEQVASLDGLTLDGREAVMVIAEYPETITPTQTLNEVPHYANQVAVPVEPGTPARLGVEIKDHKRVVRAELRFGITKPGGSGPAVVVTVNGRRIALANEDHAERLVTDQEYATTRIVQIDPAILRERNVVQVAFPDGSTGAVGTVVIRAAYDVK
ncbi:MAG: beta-agarase [Planctomycetota bacterium]